MMLLLTQEDAPWFNLPPIHKKRLPFESPARTSLLLTTLLLPNTVTFVALLENNVLLQPVIVKTESPEVYVVSVPPEPSVDTPFTRFFTTQGFAAGVAMAVPLNTNSSSTTATAARSYKEADSEPPQADA